MLVVVVYGLLKAQQVRLCIKTLTRTFLPPKPIGWSTDPYRYNPEAERDRERQRAETAEAELERLRSELEATRFERDLAKQQRHLDATRGRMKQGGVFALGALACFATFNVAPQIAHDLMTAPSVMHARVTRPERSREHEASHTLLTMTSSYRLRYACGVIMCCHRPRNRMVSFGQMVYRIDHFEPIRLPVDFFWRTPIAEDLAATTSGGEIPLPDPQEARPIMVENAEPSVDETEYAIAAVSLVINLD
jgi:hypothetical protein